MERAAHSSAAGPVVQKDPTTARALLAGVVDYAGLFPPAALPMPDAIAEYTSARLGPDAWMLGRFVVAAARLPEFADRGADHDTTSWKLSALVREGSAEDGAAVTTFNGGGAGRRASVDTIESKPATVDGVDWLGDTFAGRFDVFVEVPLGSEAGAWLERVRARNLKGKVRTGGLTADAFPTPGALLDFIDAAVRLQVPFKATAGLHHAVRGTYRLTYEAGAHQAPMYGYLNVLLATAGVRAGLPRVQAERLLTQTGAEPVIFGDSAVRWGAVELPLSALRALREDQLVSVGSCSFVEPASELHAITSS